MAVVDELTTHRFSLRFSTPSAAAVQSLPFSLLTTAAVVLVPAAAGWLSLSAGLVSSPLLSSAIAVGLSLLATRLGMALWSRCAHGEAVLFSELLLWGWLRRWRCERQLADAEHLLANLHRARGSSPALLTSDALSCLARAVEAQDPYLRGHTSRVARHASKIARAMDLSREEVGRIQVAAAVHDLGKLRIPHELLAKPGALSAAEFELIMRHPVDGARMVTVLGDRALTSIVRYHHERVDGGGYPAGLRGEHIPLGARILAVADTFDAVTSGRPYRGPKSHRDALEILRSVSGTQLDERPVEAFLGCYTDRRAVLAWSGLAAFVQRVLAVPSSASAAVGSTAGQGVVLATSALAACSLLAGVTALAYHHAPGDRISLQVPGVAAPAAAAPAANGVRSLAAAASHSAATIPALSLTGSFGARGALASNVSIAPNAAGSPFPTPPGLLATVPPVSVQHPTAPAPPQLAPAGGAPAPTGAGGAAAPSPPAPTSPGLAGPPPVRAPAPPPAPPLAPAPGQSGSNPGHSGGPPSQSGGAGAQGDGPPGRDGNGPGQSGGPPGQSGSAPGQSAGGPGQSGSAPGQSEGPPPGQADGSPGHSGGAPGQGGHGH